jgi:hypothetical protein
MPKPGKHLDKTELYESLAAFNRSISVAWEEIGKLSSLLAERHSMVTLLAKLEEVRCWANSDILGEQLEVELKDWALNGRRVKRWEQKLRREH